MIPSTMLKLNDIEDIHFVKLYMELSNIPSKT